MSEPSIIQRPRTVELSKAAHVGHLHELAGGGNDILIDRPRSRYEVSAPPKRNSSINGVARKPMLR